MSNSVPVALPLGRGFSAMLRRDLAIALRHRGDLTNPLIFFLIAVALVPIGVSPDPSVLTVLAPGMVWVMALLANLLAMDSLFRSDFDDGSLEQLAISPQPITLMVLAKVLVHWLVTGLPLSLLSPLLGLWLALPESGYAPLMMSLLLGTGSLSLIGAVGAALTVSLRKGGVLVSLIVMPLYVPVLIFGTGTVMYAIQGLSYVAPLATLGALLALALMIAPLFAGFAVKTSIGNS